MKHLLGQIGSGPHAQSWGKVVVGEMRSELGRSCCRENEVAREIQRVLHYLTRYCVQDDGMGELVYPSAVYEKWRVAMKLAAIGKGDLFWKRWTRWTRSAISSLYQARGSDSIGRAEG